MWPSLLGHIYVHAKGLPACDHPLDCRVWDPKGGGKVAVAVPFLKVPDDGILEVGTPPVPCICSSHLYIVCRSQFQTKM